MHVIDSLAAGGAERAAVNIANNLPAGNFRAFLAVTRASGPLAGIVAPQVQLLQLGRRRTLDLRAVIRLATFVRENRIAIVHAHSTSLFIAAAACLALPSVRLVWHDHFGRHEVVRRRPELYRIAGRRVNAVIAVSEALAEWARDELQIASEAVHYIPNFADPPPPCEGAPALPGRPGSRVVCVANLRPQKDHLTLVRAMAEVVRVVPSAHLLLAGGTGDSVYADQLRAEIVAQGVQTSVTVLGERDDVQAILAACDIGVLSSVSEGLPLALLEYGLAGLAVVSTRVGQCPDVLGNGQYGVLVNTGQPVELAQALVRLLTSREERGRLGERLQRHVASHFSTERVVDKVCMLYEGLFLGGEAMQ